MTPGSAAASGGAELHPATTALFVRSFLPSQSQAPCQTQVWLENACFMYTFFSARVMKRNEVSVSESPRERHDPPDDAPALTETSQNSRCWWSHGGIIHPD